MRGLGFIHVARKDKGRFALRRPLPRDRLAAHARRRRGRRRRRARQAVCVARRRRPVGRAAERRQHRRRRRRLPAHRAPPQHRGRGRDGRRRAARRDAQALRQHAGGARLRRAGARQVRRPERLRCSTAPRRAIAPSRSAASSRCWQPPIKGATTCTPYNRTALPHVLLYDIDADPSETTDVAAAKPEVVRSMLTRLAAYNATNAPCCICTGAAGWPRWTSRCSTGIGTASATRASNPDANCALMNEPPWRERGQ